MKKSYNLIFAVGAVVLLSTFPKIASADSTNDDSQMSSNTNTSINYNDYPTTGSSYFFDNNSFNSSKYVVNPGGINYKLKRTVTGNNLSASSFYAHLGGDLHHAGFSYLGDFFLNKVDKNRFYVSQLYTDEDSNYVYSKTVTNVYSNSGMTKLLDSYVRTYKLPK